MKQTVYKPETPGNEIFPTDLVKKKRLDIRIRHPFLGLAATGKAAKIGFTAADRPDRNCNFRVKSRADGPAILSKNLISFNRNSLEDMVEVRQAEPRQAPRQTVYIDVYSTPIDFCRKRGKGENDWGTSIPHRPGCDHHVATATIRFSPFLALLHGAIALLAAPVAPAKAVAVQCLTALMLLRVKAILFGRRVKPALASARAGILSTGQLAAKKVGSAGRNTRTRIFRAETRNRLRLVRRNPLTVGLTILIAAGIAVIAYGNLPPKSEAASDQVEKRATIFEVSCHGEIEKVGPDHLRQKCLIRGVDGATPDEVSCQGSSYRVEKRGNKTRLYGCQGIWH